MTEHDTPGPHVDLITDEATPEGSEGVLALVLRGTKDDPRPTTNGPMFLTPPGSPTQVAFMRYNNEKKIPLHSHIPIHRILDCPTTETLIVTKGKLMVHLWNSQRVHQRNLMLEAGDLIILFSGGHAFTICEDGTEIIEVKQGPYDKDNDKVWWDLP